MHIINFQLINEPKKVMSHFWGFFALFFILDLATSVFS